MTGAGYSEPVRFGMQGYSENRLPSPHPIADNMTNRGVGHYILALGSFLVTDSLFMVYDMFLSYMVSKDR